MGSEADIEEIAQQAADKVEIPENVSEFNNDKGYVSADLEGSEESGVPSPVNADTLGGYKLDDVISKAKPTEEENLALINRANASTVKFTEQTLSEAQQKVARENIGAEQLTEYELIANVTTTEEINTLNITVGNDGNAYALKKAIFEIMVPAAVNTKPFVLFVNHMYAFYSAKVVDTKNKQTFLCVDVVNGRLLATYYGCTGAVNSGQDDGGMLYYPVRFSSAADNIKHFQVYGVNSAVLPVGTTVTVWGVRA